MTQNIISNKCIDNGIDATFSGYNSSHYVYIFYNTLNLSVNSIKLSDSLNGLRHSTIVCHRNLIVQFGGIKDDNTSSNDLYVYQLELCPETNEHEENSIDESSESQQTLDIDSSSKENIIETSSLPFSVWNIEGDLPSARYYAVAASINTKEILFYGGTNGSDYFNDSFILNVENKTWKALACKGSPPQGMIGQTVVIWNGYKSVKNIHIDVGEDSKPNIIFYGGSTLNNDEFDTIFQLDLKMERWNRIPITLPKKCSFSSSIHIDTQIGIFSEKDEIHTKVWIAQVFPAHKVFQTYLTIKDIFEFSDFYTSFNLIYRYALYFDHKEAIQLKNKFVEQFLDKEIENFFYNETSMEVLNSTVLMRFAYELFDDFPLFRDDGPTKKSAWSLFFGGKEKEREIKKVGDLFFKLPPLFVKIEKSFKSPIMEEVKSGLLGIFSFVVGTPWDPKFLDSVLEGDSEDSLIKYNDDDRNFILKFLNLDHPLEVYNKLKNNKKYEEFPSSYQEAFQLFREKLFEIIRFGSGTQQHIGKIKWVRRVLFIFRPILSTMNPIMIVNKMMNVLLASNMGKYGIALGLEVGKTENAITAKKKSMSPELVQLIQKFKEGKSFHELDRIRAKYYIKPPSSNLTETVDIENFEEEFQKQFLRAFHLPTSARKIIFQFPEFTPTPKNAPPKKKIDREAEKKKNISIDKFKSILFDEISKNSKFNEKLTEQDINDCLDLFDLEVRLAEKKDFFKFIEESRVQQMIQDVFHVIMPIMTKMYANTDISRILTLFSDILAHQIKISETELKYDKEIKKLRLKGEKTLQSNSPTKKLIIDTQIYSPKSPSPETPPSPTSELTETTNFNEDDAFNLAEAEMDLSLKTVEQEEEFIIPITDLPEPIQKKIAELEEKKNIKVNEKIQSMDSNFQTNFFNFMSESLNRDFQNAKIIRSIAAWLTTYLTKMEGKFIDTQQIYYTEPNSNIQRQLFLRECNRILHDKY